jgi:hypothetical protein
MFHTTPDTLFTLCSTELTSCFESLNLTEKIQEIAIAVKRKIDLIVDNEEKKKEKEPCEKPENCCKCEDEDAVGGDSEDNCYKTKKVNSRISNNLIVE